MAILKKYPFPFPQKLTDDPDFEHVWLDSADELEALQEGYERITEDKHSEVVAELRKERNHERHRA